MLHGSLLIIADKKDGSVKKREEPMVKSVTVYLDNESPKFMERVRCGFIVAENEAGEETFHNDLIDNFEYPGLKELIDDIAGLLHVHRDEVWVTG